MIITLIITYYYIDIIYIISFLFLIIFIYLIHYNNFIMWMMFHILKNWSKI